MHHETSFAPTVQASALARGELDGWLTALVGGPTAETVRLAASELVTNAVRHAGITDGEPIGLSADVEDGSVRVVVTQPTLARSVAVAPKEDRGTNGGYGLMIVEALADRWGSDPGSPGGVWFEVSPAA